MPKILFSVHHQALRGYYYESLATLRIAYELLLRILYIQKFPAQIDLVILNASSGEGNKFQASNVLPHHFKVQDELYDWLSKPLHGMVQKVAQELVASQKSGGVILDLGYQYDPKLYVASMNLSIVVLYLSIRSYIAIFDPVTVNLNELNYKSLIEVIKQIHLESHLKTASIIVDQL
jgi:hypothetical protein